MTKLSLAAAHPAAVPDRADGGHRRVQGCEGTEELNCPTSEMDWGEKKPGTFSGKKKEQKH